MHRNSGLIMLEKHDYTYCYKISKICSHFSRMLILFFECGFKQDADTVKVTSGSPLPGVKVIIVCFDVKYISLFIIPCCNECSLTHFSFFFECFAISLLSNTPQFLSYSHSKLMNSSGFQRKQLTCSRTKYLALTPSS